MQCTSTYKYCNKKSTHQTSSARKNESDKQLMDTLLNCCITPKQRFLFKIVWHNQGTLTHDLTAIHGFKSNNHHNFTQSINPRLLEKGWVISKHKPLEKGASWLWFIEPAHQALMQDIHPSLRELILNQLGSANDE